jgi:hypothetical protein
MIHESFGNLVGYHQPLLNIASWRTRMNYDMVDPIHQIMIK